LKISEAFLFPARQYNERSLANLAAYCVLLCLLYTAARGRKVTLFRKGKD